LARVTFLRQEAVSILLSAALCSPWERGGLETMKEKGSFRLLLADDHVLIRLGIKNIIQTEDSLQVVGEVGNGRELMRFLESTGVDLVILDISMPGLGGMEAISMVKNKYPGIKILMLTMHKNIQFLYDAMSAGADGYLIKDDSDHEILLAITRVLSGKNYISSTLTDDVVGDVISMYRTDIKSPLQKLTRREKQVLQLVVDGYTSKKMAARLKISQRTIEHHRANLLRKLKRKNSVDLVNYAVKNGLVATDTR
jgi:DNA-binding NarL/FixJ family response regulator